MDYLLIAEVAIGVLVALIAINAYKHFTREERSKTEWMTSLPSVLDFYSLTGLKEYCRQHLPNCYDRLCLLEESPEWQSRMRYEALSLDNKDDELPLYRYFDALQVLSKGRRTPSAMFGSMQLIEYERWFRHHLYPQEDSPIIDRETIDRLLPLPENNGEP